MVWWENEPLPWSGLGVNTSFCVNSDLWLAGFCLPNHPFLGKEKNFAGFKAGRHDRRLVVIILLFNFRSTPDALVNYFGQGSFVT